ncbi:MAG: tRNA dihydrouridine synthase DusB [Defluviitaleaceae bacterium]|nr:tRNA dihydrouridine synthase DusB [Defluviitaleaceae bacterium]
MKHETRHIKIGDVHINGNIFLAPMAGVTDMAFREICKDYGAALVYSELISAKGILYESSNTFRLTDTSEKERPVVLQIFGSDPKILSEAAKKIEHLPFDILDINMGCPAPKIVKNGDGSALIENPKLVGEIVKSVSSSIKKPLTIKIRKGINGKITAVEVAKYAQENGVSAITVHGRTREQQYEGVVDLDIIAKVKEAVEIPVFASGDVVDIESAKRTFETTSCDALMIGRGSFGNPWIFKKINHYFETGEILEDPTTKEKVDMCLYHARKLCEYKGEQIAIRELRKQSGWYIKNLYGSTLIRVEINKTKTLKELENLLMTLI